MDDIWIYVAFRGHNRVSQPYFLLPLLPHVYRTIALLLFLQFNNNNLFLKSEHSLTGEYDCFDG